MDTLGVRGTAGAKVYGGGTCWEFSVARDKLSGNVKSFSFQKLFPGPAGAIEKGFLKVLEAPCSRLAWTETMNTQCGQCRDPWVSSLCTRSAWHRNAIPASHSDSVNNI